MVLLAFLIFQAAPEAGVLAAQAAWFECVDRYATAWSPLPDTADLVATAAIGRCIGGERRFSEATGAMLDEMIRRNPRGAVPGEKQTRVAREVTIAREQIREHAIMAVIRARARRLNLVEPAQQ